MPNVPFNKTKTIYRFVNDIFPLVKEELSYWKHMAKQIPDPVLSQQALASIQKKGFHAQGGSIYGQYNGFINAGLIRFIVALQTISDYLDNLCDRVGVEDQHAFLCLHDAISDALKPHDQLEDYYNLYPHKEDGGYLHSLVCTCKEYIRSLPGYDRVQNEIIFLGKIYGEMQSYKHIQPSEREQVMKNWANSYLKSYPDISVWEFSAAAGSTLGIFLLCALAEDKDLSKNEVNQALNTYFPWVCGLHILLDYFIDEREDRATGDLNFVSYYCSNKEKKERLQLFLSQSFKRVSNLSNSFFHQTVIEGLLAMYLSDPKASIDMEKSIGSGLINESTRAAHILFYICKMLRKNKLILS